MGNTKVYISSTYSDLVKYWERVYNVLRKMRYDVIAMEDYVATDERPLDKCLADVSGSDVYVGIFVWRYGYIPPGQTLRHEGMHDLEDQIAHTSLPHHCPHERPILACLSTDRPAHAAEITQKFIPLFSPMEMTS